MPQAAATIATMPQTGSPVRAGLVGSTAGVAVGAGFTVGVGAGVSVGAAVGVACGVAVGRLAVLPAEPAAGAGVAASAAVSV